MYIDDEELRELYKVSSSAHLAKLESELMLLEQNPQDGSAMEEFLREAHTLKGDSRMLGLDDIEAVVHHLEDCVEDIKAGKGELTAELCDRLYRGIDAINQLSHEAITGESTNVNVAAVLASLTGTSESAGNPATDLFGDEPESTGSLFDDDDDSDFLGNDRSSEASLFDDDDSGFLSDAVESANSLFDDDDDEKSEPTDFLTAPTESNVEKISKPLQVGVSSSTRSNQIDTIRVEPQKLDTLMTQASELAVTKLRISQQMTEIERMLNLTEGWNKYNSHT